MSYDPCAWLTIDEPMEVPCERCTRQFEEERDRLDRVAAALYLKRILDRYNEAAAEPIDADDTIPAIPRIPKEWLKAVPHTCGADAEGEDTSDNERTGM